MVMSRRERYILLVTALAVGLFILNWGVIDPLLAERMVLAGKIDGLQPKVRKAQGLIENVPRMERAYHDMVGSGVKTNASEAESQLYRAVDECAQQSGFNVATSTRDRATEKERGFFRMTVRYTGGGSMQQVSRFLYNLQQSTLPVRVTDLSITPRREATDDLTVSFGLSTIFLPADPTKPAAANATTREVAQ